MALNIGKLINLLASPRIVENQDIDIAFSQLLQICEDRFFLDRILRELEKRRADAVATAHGETRIYQRIWAIAVRKELHVQDYEGRGLVDIGLDQATLDDLLDEGKLPEMRERKKDHSRRRENFERRIRYLNSWIDFDPFDEQATQTLCGTIASELIKMLMGMVEGEKSVLQIIDMDIENRKIALNL